MVGRGTHNAGYNRRSREFRAKGLFIPYAVLDDHDGGFVADGGLEARRYGFLVECFMRADDVVEWARYLVDGVEDCCCY